jgi:hypothetical protein
MQILVFFILSNAFLVVSCSWFISALYNIKMQTLMCKDIVCHMYYILLSLYTLQADWELLPKAVNFVEKDVRNALLSKLFLCVQNTELLGYQISLSFKTLNARSPSAMKEWQ